MCQRNVVGKEGESPSHRGEIMSSVGNMYNGSSNGGMCHDNGMKNGSSMENQPKTLYVGNLDPSVTEEFVATLFSQMGALTGCKMIHEPGNDPYCFVEYSDHMSAATALNTYNKRKVLGRELKVNWATSPGATGPKQDTSKHHHIFVGDLSPELDTQQLRDAFAVFGEISDCRVVRDPQTLKSKGYGFVSFVKKTDAESAIQTMNGQWLGSRAIRTNWATRKPPSRGGGEMTGVGSGGSKMMSFEEVYQQSSPTNCTVYCGGLLQGLSEEIVQKTFAQFGPIQEIRVFKEKGYAFIKFASKEIATTAIVAVHNTEVNGQIVKCSWGKETGDPANHVNVSTGGGLNFPPGSAYPQPYPAPLGYWYPQGFPGHQPLQPGQFSAGAVQGHPAAAGIPAPYGPAAAAYGQFYAAAAGGGNPHHPNFNMSWQPTNGPSGPGQHQQGGGGQNHHMAGNHHHGPPQSALGPSLQQHQPLIGGYPMHSAYTAP